MADLILRDVRLSFPDLWHATEFKPGDGKPRWNATFLIEPGSANDKAIRAAILEAAKEVWGDKAPAMLRTLEGQKNQYCYLDGNTKTYDGYEGMWALSCHRAAKDRKGNPSTPPVVIDRDKSPLADTSGKPYAGCYVNAKVSFYCQKGENPGARASFSVVQYFRKGDAFSASSVSTDEFEDLGAGADADDLVDDLA